MSTAASCLGALSVDGPAAVDLNLCLVAVDFAAAGCPRFVFRVVTLRFQDLPLKPSCKFLIM